jgi:hypothetical protein
LCIEKIEVCEEKRKMTLSLKVQFHGSAINLLVSRDEATLGRIHLQLVAVLGSHLIGYSTVTNYLRQQHFPSPHRETIARNPLGFPLIVALPKGGTFNTEYYRDTIVAALTQLQPEDDGK